jgi:uncharacterized membrane protein YjjP (DUF1212 family)
VEWDVSHGVRSALSTTMPPELTDIDRAHNESFIEELARSLLAFGAPAHRMETQLSEAAQELRTPAEFVVLPNVVFGAFSRNEMTTTDGLRVYRREGDLSLSKLRDTQAIFKRVIKEENTEKRMSPEAGLQALKRIQKEDPPYSNRFLTIIAFLCGFVITLLAFDGSVLDAILSGLAAAFFCFINFLFTEPIFARIFE